MNNTDDTNTILVVDDNSTNLKVLTNILNSANYRVAIAKSGESALQKLETNIPDIILLDVMMPGIDGFETCRQIKENPITKEIPIIFITALTDAEDKVKGLKMGAVDYITKPFNIREILARVNLHLTLKKLNQTLQNRNEELIKTIKERDVALEDLQKSQLKLVQQEKMSALGQLVAGIAHEMNNSVNFICGNIPHAQQYTEDILELIQAYEKEYINPSVEIQELAEDIEIDFLKKDLTKLLSSIELGGNRIQEIISSLRVFSHLDGGECKEMDIHEGIDSTLVLLNSRLKGTKKSDIIEVVKEYNNLPLVYCYPGQINQVFMNLLSNAIDAINELKIYKKNEEIANYLPKITITTKLIDNDRISIMFQDNGIGIKEKINKLFDPFFTTKDVGKGTGLGLSISHSIIVEKHKGKLYYKSIPKEGTTFIIEIPISQ